MDHQQLKAFCDQIWADEILPALIEYIAIPNRSPVFDPSWATHGHMDRAVALFERWAQAHVPQGATVEVVRLPGRTPLLLVEWPGVGDDRVLIYGHLDKQPEMTGWREGLGPWTPVLEGERLFGRGGADDGYAMFGAIAALQALADQGVAHAPCTLIIEASEESGSPDLPAYVEHLADRIGTPSLVVCLDSGCGNYDQLWLTTSLRGNLVGELTVRVLNEGVHSGDASGVVPSSFRILRALLSRLENELTGRISAEALNTVIPEHRLAQARIAAQALGSELYCKFPGVDGLRAVSDDPVELILNRTWRPQLALIGFDGAPAPAEAGNVFLPFSTARLTLRLPPDVAAGPAGAYLKALFEDDPPYGAQVSFKLGRALNGWHAPATAPWLADALDDASRTAFGAPAAYMGEGGSIPFMAMLGDMFPQAQFVITGVLGPHSNAHGPNEFLDLPTGRRLSMAMALVLAAHLRRGR